MTDPSYSLAWNAPELNDEVAWRIRSAILVININTWILMQLLPRFRVNTSAKAKVVPRQIRNDEFYEIAQTRYLVSSFWIVNNSPCIIRGSHELQRLARLPKSKISRCANGL